MAYEIVWTDEAENDLSSIVFYLIENWSHASADRFLVVVNQKIEKLIRTPSLARPTSRPGRFIYKLDNKNVFFLTFEGNSIILLSIYPYKKDISKSKYY